MIKLPARYAKFIAALIGDAVLYVQLYGTTWHLVPAVTMAGVALAVLGVPNAPKLPGPVAGVPSYIVPQPSSGGGAVTIKPPDYGGQA